MGLATVTIALRDAVKAAIAVNHSSGSGTYDLSATDQVQIGRAFSPPGSAAFVCVATPTLQGTRDGATNRDHAYIATIDIQGWVPVTADTPAARSTAALNLMGDIASAVKASRYDAGGAIRAINEVRDLVKIDLTEIEGEEFGVPPDFASVFGTLEFLVAINRGL